ncbi:MAG TPA: hypothetical protein VGH80_14125 [Xanthomonadaceae bacterium]|jgi:hypothetical protein
MFDWFRKRLLLDPVASEWIFAAFGWALLNFGTDFFRGATVLVKPSDRHFPDRIGDANQLVGSIFERVRVFAGMQAWPCKLAVQQADPNIHVAPTVLIKDAPQGPAGTFRMRSTEDGSDTHALITFNPSQVGDPEALVATFAHELAHYLAHSVEELPPGGEEFEELATDVLAVVMGFGLFIANGAFRYRQYQSGNVQGWSVRRQGYLHREEATYALAIFCALKAIPEREAVQHLQDGLVPPFRKAYREILPSPALAALRAIESPKNPDGVRVLPRAWRSLQPA